MTSSPALEFSLSVLRVLHDLGLVLVAGLLGFLLLAWPDSPRGPRPPRLLATGLWITAFATVAAPAVTRVAEDAPLTSVVSRAHGAAVLLELALLALVAGFFRDLVGRPLRRGRRPTPSGWAAGALALGLCAVGATPTAVTGAADGAISYVLLALHLLAMAVLLGGLATLTAVVTAGAPPHVLDEIVARSLPVAYACLAVLAATGTTQTLIGPAGSPLTTAYAVLLAIKLALVAALVIAGGPVRGYALDVAFRRRVSPAPVSRATTTADLERALTRQAYVAAALLVVGSGLVHLST